MADTTTGLIVQTKAGQFVATKLTDAGGSNVAAVSAAGALKVDGSAVTQPVSGTVTANAGTGTFGTNVAQYGGTAVGATNAVHVQPGTGATFAISAASLPLPTGAATSAAQTAAQIVDNAAFTDGTTSVGIAGFVFDETAGTALTENDAAAARIDSKRAQIGVLEDATTRGRRATITAGGALLTDSSATTQPVSGTVTANTGTGFPASLGQKAMAASFAVVIASDQSAIAVTPAANSAVNIAQYGGSATTLGQKTMAASMPVTLASDQSNVPINLTQVAGAAPSATNALAVRLTDGASFYTASGSGGSTTPTSPTLSTQTSAALGVGATTTMNHFVTSGKTGRLWGMDVASTVPLKVEIGTILTGAFTPRVVLFAEPFVGLTWRAPHELYVTQASANASTGFGCRVTNEDAANAADVYSTGFWAEV